MSKKYRWLGQAAVVPAQYEVRIYATYVSDYLDCFLCHVCLSVYRAMPTPAAAMSEMSSRTWEWESMDTMTTRNEWSILEKSNGKRMGRDNPKVNLICVYLRKKL